MKRSAVQTTSRLLFLPVALMAFAVGCARIQVVATSDRPIGAPIYPATSPTSVEILREALARPYEKLGEIFIEPSGGFPPEEKIEAELRKEGARFGADAVLIIYDRTQPSGKSYTGGPLGVEEPIFGHSVRAEAIKYKQD